MSASRTHLGDTRDWHGLQGLATIVTGAAGGLGLAYARDLARRGARLVLNDLDPAALGEAVESVRAAGGVAVAVCADVAEWSTGELLVRRCVEEFGRVDGLVNNAGVLHVAGPAEEDPARFRAALEVNVAGSYTCGIHALRQMLAQGSGSVVNISSGAAYGFPGLAAYGATKAAVLGMTRSWALDVEGTPVRCNAVMPVGATRMAHSAASWVRSVSGTWPAGEVPPERPASVVAYLLDDVSAGINGHVVGYDGHRLSVRSGRGDTAPVVAACPDGSDPAAVLDGLLWPSAGTTSPHGTV